MAPFPPWIPKNSLNEWMISAINSSTSLFYSLSGKVTKVHKRQSMNKPGKNRDETCLATLLFSRVLEFHMRKQKVSSKLSSQHYFCKRKKRLILEACFSQICLFLHVPFLQIPVVDINFFSFCATFSHLPQTTQGDYDIFITIHHNKDKHPSIGYSKLLLS